MLCAWCWAKEMQQVQSHCVWCCEVVAIVSVVNSEVVIESWPHPFGFPSDNWINQAIFARLYNKLDHFSRIKKAGQNLQLSLTGVRVYMYVYVCMFILHSDCTINIGSVYISACKCSSQSEGDIWSSEFTDPVRKLLLDVVREMNVWDKREVVFLDWIRRSLKCVRVWGSQRVFVRMN